MSISLCGADTRVRAVVKMFGAAALTRDGVMVGGQESGVNRFWLAGAGQSRLNDVYDPLFLLFLENNGAPHAPAASSAPNKTTTSMLARPSGDQYTSRRFSHRANSSSVSAAPTP